METSNISGEIERLQVYWIVRDFVKGKILAHLSTEGLTKITPFFAFIKGKQM